MMLVWSLLVAALYVTAQQTALAPDNAALQYTGSWQKITIPNAICSSSPVAVAQSTSNEGDSVSFQIAGVSKFSVQGFISATSSAAYKINFDTLTSTADGSTLPINTTSAACSDLFSIPNIDVSTAHKVTITHAGPGSGVPSGQPAILVISDILLVGAAGTGSSSSSASTSRSISVASSVSASSSGSGSVSQSISLPSSAASTPTSSGVASTSPSKVPVVIGAIAGVVLFSALLGLVYLVLRRRRALQGGQQWRSNFFNGNRGGNTPGAHTVDHLDLAGSEAGHGYGYGEKLGLQALRTPPLESNEFHADSYLHFNPSRQPSPLPSPGSGHSAAYSGLAPRGPDVPITPMPDSPYTPQGHLHVQNPNADGSFSPTVPPRPENVHLNPRLPQHAQLDAISESGGISYQRHNPTNSVPTSHFSTYSDAFSGMTGPNINIHEPPSISQTLAAPEHMYTRQSSTSSPSIRTARTNYTTASNMTGMSNFVLASAEREVMRVERVLHTPGPSPSSGDASFSSGRT